MNTKKYKATTALTGEDFPPLSRNSTKTFNPKFLSITPPHKNILFSEIACPTHDNCCNNTISVTNTLPQVITTGYMKSKLKTENVTCIKTGPTTVRQRDTTNNSATTRYYQEKENTNQGIPNFIQHHIQQYL